MRFQPSALCNGTHGSACKWRALENLNHLEIYLQNIPNWPRAPAKLQGFELPLLFQGGSWPPALKRVWGATLSLQEWRMDSYPAAQRSQSRLLLWDDMLLYIPIWIRLLWNVRKCVVSGRHRQCPLLPATARSQMLFRNCILFEFDFVKYSRAAYIQSTVPLVPVEST